MGSRSTTTRSALSDAACTSLARPNAFRRRRERLADTPIPMLFPAADTPWETTAMYRLSYRLSHRISPRTLTSAALLSLFATSAFAQNSATPAAASDATATPTTEFAAKDPLVEFELMTWPEVKAALAAGKTTALFYTGGTEQRGPQNVNGGHTLMGREIVRAIALRLGNAIAMPVLPYTPNNASADLPGTIGLTPEILAAILERVSEQAIATGFKNVVIMGDHGGGQPQTYAEVAKKLEAKYASEGKHVYFCDEVYAKAQGDFDK